MNERYHYVELPEDTWFKYDALLQDELFQQWCEIAKHDNYTHVALRVVPDPVFPRDANKTKPYIVRQECIIENAPDFHLETKTVAFIREDVWRAVEGRGKERSDLIARVRTAAINNTPPGGTWAIHANVSGVPQIEKGRCYAR